MPARSCAAAPGPGSSGRPQADPVRVLITRPHEDAAPLAARLAGLGVDSLTEPLLRIRFLPGPALDLAGVQALLVTSANGVRAFAARQDDRDVPAYAVGDASARAARDLGFARVYSAGGDVDSLADLVRRRLDPAAGALLHVAGSKVAGDLAGQLGDAGFEVRREVLYRAETSTALSPQAAAALAGGSLHGVLLFSPRTAATFADLLARAGLQDACARLAAYCLSAAVRERVASLPWRRLRMAARPDQDSLVALVAGAAEAGET
ncbi:MAG: uroporphyrinogen-III synthase [Hyphomicrobiales bacterium]|nr:uroporphyrinogen-III synthase [Hyphomicrobiales bacterium]MCP5370413.1 uroporphyrinogen-III synthase [Hyphomicrobiales bacterium]